MPFCKFFPRDWLSDFQLRGCSLAARGLWADMLCLMAMSDRRGYLEENRKPMLPAQLARRIGAKLAEVKRLLAMLEQAGVFSRDDKGVIYSRRMVDDERRTVEARRWGNRAATRS